MRGAVYALGIVTMLALFAAGWYASRDADACEKRGGVDVRGQCVARECLR